MRLQLPKIHDPENPHKYWVFGTCRSYKVAADGTLTFEQLEDLLEQAVADGAAKKTVYGEDESRYRIDILQADMYHTVFVSRDTAGVYTVEIGDVVTLPILDEAAVKMLGLPETPDGNLYF